MTTPTPALRSAIEQARQAHHEAKRKYQDGFDCVPFCELSAAMEALLVTLSSLAPAPVEQAALAAAKEIDYTTPWETPRAEHWARIITRHFQSLATENKDSERLKQLTRICRNALAFGLNGADAYSAHEACENGDEMRNLIAAIDAARAATGRGDGK